MKLTCFEPQNAILKQYITCFYTLERQGDDTPEAYLGFPSTHVFLVLFNETEVRAADSECMFKHDPTQSAASYLIMDFEKAGITHYEGKIAEITVYFKPLGLNAFLEKPLSNYHKGVLSEFTPFDDYAELLKKIFDTKGGESRLKILENYLLSKLKGFEHPFLHRAVEQILEKPDTPPRVSQLAKQFGVSRMTFNKQFSLHLCTSPGQFIKIVRFRQAMKRFSIKPAHENLVDIAYWAEYFDQSHMIKDFKSLTGFAPKPFFAKLSSLENGQINWLFL